jgi:hypothetical protein
MMHHVNRHTDTAGDDGDDDDDDEDDDDDDLQTDEAACQPAQAD